MRQSSGIGHTIPEFLNIYKEFNGNRRNQIRNQEERVKMLIFISSMIATMILFDFGGLRLNRSRV